MGQTGENPVAVSGEVRVKGNGFGRSKRDRRGEVRIGCVLCGHRSVVEEVGT